MRLSTAALTVDTGESMTTACDGNHSDEPTFVKSAQPEGHVNGTAVMSMSDGLICSAMRASPDVSTNHTLPCHATEPPCGVIGNVLQKSAESSMLPPHGSAPEQVNKALTSSISSPTSLPNSTFNQGSKTSGGSKQGPNEKLQRSRERNRIHARKTRQRKKEQMQNLQNRADELKQEQIQLKQSINEKNTASILVGLFSTNTCDNSQQNEDPEVELLLRRPAEDIPDASKIPELPALILPGQHNSKKVKADILGMKKEVRNDGIDYELLGKDRSKCTPEELDRIRRERNRMHAKRTRDRKRLFMEEMAEMCKTLEGENHVLKKHLQSLDEKNSTQSSSANVPASSQPNASPFMVPTASDDVKSFKSKPAPASSSSASRSGVTYDQIKTLLEAAGKFDSPSPASGMMSLGSMAVSVAAATVSENNSSAGASVSDENDDHSNPNQSHFHANKRPRLSETRGASIPAVSSAVPQSITTSTAVGC